MKFFYISLVLCFLALSNAMAQIEIFDESAQQKVEDPETLPYDSLNNVVPYKYNLNHLIGQTLMYCGDPYEDNTLFSSEIGGYYHVDGIVSPNSRFNNELILTNIKTGARIERTFDTTSSGINYKWVVVGHYEKLRSLYVNKEFVCVDAPTYVVNKADGIINLETDTATINISEGSVWTCTGVQVKPRKEGDGLNYDERSPIVLIFNNPDYGEHYCYFEDRNGNQHKFPEDTLLCSKFQLKSHYDKIKADIAAAEAKRKAELTRKFGASNTTLILEGKVRIGMTKAMCEESWGHPNRINKSVYSWGTSEQWVYGGGNYLYFEGDKLTSIQN